MKFETKLFRTFFGYTILAIILISVVLLIFFYNSYLIIERKNLYLINTLLQNQINNIIENFSRLTKEIIDGRDFQYLFDEDKLTSFFAKKSLLKVFNTILETNPFLFEIRIQKGKDIVLSSNPHPLDVRLDEEIHKEGKKLYRILKWDTYYKDVKIILIVKINKILHSFNSLISKEGVLYIIRNAALSFNKSGEIELYDIHLNKETNMLVIGKHKYLVPRIKTPYLLKAAIPIDSMLRNIEAFMLMMLIFIFIIGAIFYIITKKTSSYFAKPISKLSKVLMSVRNGKFKKCTCGYESVYEIKILINSFNLMIDEIKDFTQKLEDMVKERTAIIEKQKQDLERLNKKLERLSITDKLTDVYNRRYFDEKISEDFEVARRNKLFMGLTIIDIDDFKQINDTYGHLFGDFVIEEVAKIIVSLFKRKTDRIFRYGGDEFIVYTFYPEYRKNEFFSMLEDLRTHIEEKVFIYDEGEGKETIKLSISIGAFFGRIESQESVDSVLAKADEMLYKSKETGKNQVTIWEDKIH